MLRVCYGIFGGEENNNSIRSMIYGAQRRNRTTDTRIFNKCVVIKICYINNLNSTKINVLRVVLQGLKFRLDSQRFVAYQLTHQYIAE